MALETGTYINDLVITNPTGADPKSTSDDHHRLLKKVLKECLNGFTGGILLTASDTGTAAAHVLTPTTALVGYTFGLMLLYRPANAGTGALTVNVSGLGAKSVKLINGADPTADDVLASQPLLLMYDGTNFVVIGGSPYLSKTGNQTITGNIAITGNQTVSGTFDATGNATLGGTAGIAGNTTVGGTLAVTGIATFTGDLQGAGADKKADKAGSTYTGTHDFSGAAAVKAPTMALGTSTTDVATMAALAARAMSSTIPVSPADIGKVLGAGDGAVPAWTNVGITNIVSSATSITLTSTPTLAVMTPASYGVSVTMQDATSDTPKEGFHAIDNNGAYPLRVFDSTGTLKGFIFPGKKSSVGLVTASAAGVWSFSDIELVGVSAQLLPTYFYNSLTSLDIGASREMLLWSGTSGYGYAIVYDRSTNTWGAETLVRSTNISTLGFMAVLSATNQVLAISVTNAGAALEAVTLSVSGTEITVNTALPITLAGAITDSLALLATATAGLFAVVERDAGGVFIRALGVNGTTVATSAATNLTNGSTQYMLMSGSVAVVFASAASTWITPYTIAGTPTVPTVTIGTGVTVTNFSPTKFGTFSSGRMFAIGSAGVVRVVTLTGTVITSSVATIFSVGSVLDAIVVGSNKVLLVNDQGATNANILTDTSGSAGAGTAITLDTQTSRAALYASGTDVVVQSGTTTYGAYVVDCSGASPVKSKIISSAGSSTQAPAFSSSDSKLVRSPNAVYGSAFACTARLTGNNQSFDAQVKDGAFTRVPHQSYAGDYGGSAWSGRLPSEVFVTDSASSVITKVECVQ